VDELTASGADCFGEVWVLPNGAELLPMAQADFDEMLASPS
jgi:hypothetical protein